MNWLLMYKSLQMMSNLLLYTYYKVVPLTLTLHYTDKCLLLKWNNTYACSATASWAVSILVWVCHFLDFFSTTNHTDFKYSFCSSWIKLFSVLTDTDLNCFSLQAGLVTESEPERLIFALEPEAASVFCMHLPKEGFIAEEFSTDTLKQSPGTQYMVVDCGGTLFAAILDTFFFHSSEWNSYVN